LGVVDTRLYNLTNDEVPVIVHLGTDKWEKHTLVRLKQPSNDKGSSGGAKAF